MILKDPKHPALSTEPRLRRLVDVLVFTRPVLLAMLEMRQALSISARPTIYGPFRHVVFATFACSDDGTSGRQPRNRTHKVRTLLPRRRMGHGIQGISIA